ncbi:MAG: magnesium chelatase subunit H [Gammaproteobacteria bacterium]|nr:magnesium chelatase subunit H [Gammaproteobacteria bacterium]
MPKPTLVADTKVSTRVTARVVIITLDSHLAGAVDRAKVTLAKDVPGLHLSLHGASEWGENSEALERCIEDIGRGDIIIVTMMFLEDHIRAVLPALQARRDDCDAMVCCMSSAEIIKLTRIGKFTMDGKQSGPMALLKRLRGGSKNSNEPKNASSGAKQMAMLRRLPKILRFIPGTAQDVRAYFLTLQYWLSGSEHNIEQLVRFMVNRYADGPRRSLRGKVRAEDPIEYPEVGVYHPRLPGRIGADASKLPQPKGEQRGCVGLLLMRSYLLAGNAAHYDAVISELEGRGLKVIPAFASGLDARPAVETYFLDHGVSKVDAVISLTGFSLVGGPAYNDASAAEAMLAELDVPCIAAQAIEFQTLEQWQGSAQGLLPVEATMMVAIPELDGATGSMVFGGRSDNPASGAAQDMQPHPERIDRLADRVANLVRLRRTAASERRVAMVLFGFPPNAGAVGTAAFLSVFASLYNTLVAMRDAGYTVEVPESVDALREQILQGNARKLGAPANVHTQIPVDDHVRRESWLDAIEGQWGPAPGRDLTDGRSLFVLGASFGNVFVGVQPTFGYEGDPMRLLFEGGFTPTHAFSAFYRYLREDLDAHAVLHFGTHGALEFMPGKQTALSGECWPDRLIGALPNFYLYACNNPSEGAIAKRRSAATLISYLTPPVAHAGLYAGLGELRSSIERWRTLEPEATEEHAQLAELIGAQAAELDLLPATQTFEAASWDQDIRDLGARLKEIEDTLVPYGMHTIGEGLDASQRRGQLNAMAEAQLGHCPPQAMVAAVLAGEDDRTIVAQGALEATPEHLAFAAELRRIDKVLSEDHEMPSLLAALDGRYVRPVVGGDLLRSPDILPTGRNLHGFDPFRMPSLFAAETGARQADQLLARHAAEGQGFPESVALVLWGTDNIKSEGTPIGQALALMGARPRFDSYGRLCGARLISLEELGRPRIDVIITLSGIFRDLLPMQTRMLAEAALLAAQADEPEDENFIRKHALVYQAAHGCDMETASLRVFSNADGTYGSNVNQLIDSGAWEDEDELAETYTRRKCFAYGVNGKPLRQPELLGSMLAGVELTFQNVESVELGVTSLDHYFDTLGGISRAVKRSRGSAVPVYIGDATRGENQIRTLNEQVALETRTRMLNPKWFESLLACGHEGVKSLEAHLTNTMGWSATTGKVEPWVYQRLTQTFVLDADMRERLAELNPTASARFMNRLLEAHERDYWTPEPDVLEVLRQAGADIEDRLEGITEEVAA